MRIRRNKVVIADRAELEKPEDADQQQAGKRGRERVADEIDQSIRQYDEKREDREICDHDTTQRNTQKAHDNRIEIRRERAVEVSDIAIENSAFAQLPRHVELAPEIHE